MSKSERIIFQELAEKFKKIEENFVKLKVEIKEKLKELQCEKANKSSLKTVFL